jgi:hypothetical protein
MFHVDKWYFDAIDDRGAVIVVYSARVEWGRLHVDYASVLRVSEGGDRREASTVRLVDRPRLRGDVLTWCSEPLAVDGEWHRQADPIRRTLASGPEGAIQWTCHMPRARASIHVGDAAFEGLGYVERLHLTLPLSKLPFRTLRWGRHVSTRHSLIWIDWAGGTDRRWVWLDGEEQRAPALSGDAPSELPNGATLRLRDRRDVCDRPVLAALGLLPPALTRRVAGGIAGMHEHKMVSRSSIVVDGGAVDDGWSLYEVVTKPEIRGSRSRVRGSRAEPGGSRAL